jgi:hypothetical protein
MAKPLPLPIWDRQRAKLVSEWMEDHTPTYESEPQRSITQWIKSQPLYDWLYAAYENTRWSARQIEPFVRKYHRAQLPRTLHPWFEEVLPVPRGPTSCCVWCR